MFDLGERVALSSSTSSRTGQTPLITARPIPSTSSGSSKMQNRPGWSSLSGTTPTSRILF